MHLPLSDSTFHDRLMWDRATIKRRSHYAFYCSRDGSLIWDPRHTHGGPNDIVQSPFDAYDATLDVLFSIIPTPKSKEITLKEASLLS